MWSISHLLSSLFQDYLPRYTFYAGSVDVFFHSTLLQMNLCPPDQQWSMLVTDASMTPFKQLYHSLIWHCWEWSSLRYCQSFAKIACNTAAQGVPYFHSNWKSNMQFTCAQEVLYTFQLQDVPTASFVFLFFFKVSSEALLTDQVI